MKNLIVLAFLVFSTISPAFSKGIFDELGITAEQKEKIQAIRKAHKEQMQKEIDAVLTHAQKKKRDQLKAEAKEKRKNNLKSNKEKSKDDE